MGKHVNAGATSDQDDAAVAAAGTEDGAHHGAARHSAEGGQSFESGVGVVADAPAEAEQPGVDSDVE